MTEIVPINEPGASDALGYRARREVAQTQRRQMAQLMRIETATLVRVAKVRAESIVQTEKMHEIDYLAREAMSGQAMLHQWAAVLANGNEFALDDLSTFVKLAKQGKAQVLLDTIEAYGRDSRRHA